MAPSVQPVVARPSDVCGLLHVCRKPVNVIVCLVKTRRANNRFVHIHVIYIYIHMYIYIYIYLVVFSALGL